VEAVILTNDYRLETDSNLFPEALLLIKMQSAVDEVRSAFLTHFF
jgi:hypothetical protein